MDPNKVDLLALPGMEVLVASVGSAIGFVAVAAAGIHFGRKFSIRHQLRSIRKGTEPPAPEAITDTSHAEHFTNLPQRDADLFEIQAILRATDVAAGRLPQPDPDAMPQLPPDTPPASA